MSKILQNDSTKRRLKMVSQTSVAMLVLGSMFTPVSAMAETLSNTNLRAHIAVDGQVLSDAYLFITPDPSTHKPTAFVPAWYAFYLLKPYGLSYTWDPNTDSLYITASGTGSSTVPTSVIDKAGNLKVYVNGQLVQTMIRHVVTDPTSKKPTLYVPVWYMDQVFSKINVQGSWDGLHQIWNLSFGANSQGVIKPMVMTISNAIANSPFLVTVNPIGLDGKPIGPGHTVTVTGSDGQTVQAVWDAQTQAYEAVVTASQTTDLTFRTTVDGVPIPSAAKTVVNPQGGTPTPGNTVVQAMANPDGTVTISVDPEDANGKPTGAGQHITVTASNGQQETATWNPATQNYQVTVSSTGNQSGGTNLSSLTFDVTTNPNTGTPPQTLAQNVKVENPSSGGTSTGGTNSGGKSNPVPTSLGITVGNLTVTGTADSYNPTAQVVDQYGNAMGGQTVTWSIQGAAPKGVSMNRTTGQVTIDSTQASSGSFTIQAADGSVTNTATVNYTKPVATSTATKASVTLGSASVNAAGTTTSYAPNVTIYDQNSNAMGGQTVTWSIQGGTPTGVTINGTTGAISIDAHTYVGTGITVVATDGTVTGTATLTYTKPASVPTSLGITVGSLSFSGSTDSSNPTAQVTDQYGNAMSGQNLTWSIQGTAPTGVSINSTTGQVSIDSTQASSGSFAIQAADGSVTNTATVNYTQPMATTAQVTLGSGRVNLAGTTIFYAPNVTVYDQNSNAMSGQTVTWSIQGGTPTGVTIGSTSGAIGIDANTYVGTGFTIVATDGTATGTATLTYTKPASEATSLGITVGNLTVTGATNSYNPTAQVFDQYSNVMSGQTVTWSFQGPAPTGVSINSTTGQVTIDSTQASSGSFTIQATDGSVNNTATVNYTKPVAKPTKASVTLGSASVNAAGTSTSYAPKVTIYDQNSNAMSGQTVIWSIQGGTPTGVTINSTTGAISIDAKTYVGTGFTVVATDGTVTGTATLTYTKPASVPTKVIINKGTNTFSGMLTYVNPTAQVFDQYGNAMNGATVTWSIQGNTPTGVSINSTTGQVRASQTPSMFTIVATDGSARSTQFIALRG